MVSSDGMEEEKTPDVAEDKNGNDHAKSKAAADENGPADAGEVQPLNAGGGNSGEYDENLKKEQSVAAEDGKREGVAAADENGPADSGEDQPLHAGRGNSGEDDENLNKEQSVAAEDGKREGVAAADENGPADAGEVQPLNAEGGNSGEDDENLKKEQSVAAEDGKREGVAAKDVNQEGSDDEEDEGQEDGSPKPMSKTAMKKAIKERDWKIKKKMKKAAEKEKRHAETKRKRKEWEEKLASMTEEEIAKAKEEKVNSRKERKDEQKQRKERLREALTSGQNYVLDLEFCDLMKPQEVTSLIQQVMYCYSANSRAEHPGRLTLTGVNGKIKEALEKISGYSNWLIHREEQSYMDVFKDRAGSLVYLTADSETILEDIDKSKIYIIGGLVDRNRWKNITLEKAKKQGIATAKIPVGDHLKMTASQVLTVNQVMELMLCYLRLKDWKQTLLQVVPPRKRAADSKLEKEGKGEEDEPASD